METIYLVARECYLVDGGELIEKKNYGAYRTAERAERVRSSIYLDEIAGLAEELSKGVEFNWLVEPINLMN